MKIHDRQHARISPSGVERALNCTQSVRLSASLPPRLAGPEAAAGTAAHALFERCLREDLDVFELSTGPVEVDGHTVDIDEEMLERLQICVDWVRENVPRPWLLEERMQFGFLESITGEPVYGHLDVGSVEETIVVVDLKTGFNPVPADDPQLLMYLLGLVEDHHAYPEGNDDVVAGQTVVLQPATGGEVADVYEVTWAELRAFRKWLVDGFTRVARGQWSYADGPWCRWCPVASACPHLRALALDAPLTRIAPNAELVASGEYSAEHLDAALVFIRNVLDPWVRAVDHAAESYMVHGGLLASHKLVRKRANRRWCLPEDEVASVLKTHGIDPFEDPKLVSPAQAEKRLPKAKRAIVDDLAEKPLGELTVAPIDDKRPAVEVAASFAAAVQSHQARGFLAAAKQRKD